MKYQGRWDRLWVAVTDEARFIRKSWFRCVREVCDLEMDKCKVAMDEVKTKKVTVLMLRKLSLQIMMTIQLRDHKVPDDANKIFESEEASGLVKAESF